MLSEYLQMCLDSRSEHLKSVFNDTKGGTQKQEKEGPALEDQLTDLTCRLADEPSDGPGRDPRHDSSGCG